MTALIAFIYIAKSLCAVAVIFFITQVRGLTPEWPTAWRHHLAGEKLIRIGICAAWLVLMIENNYAASSLLLGEQELDPGDGSGFLFVLQHVASALILLHFAWLAWRADFRRRL